MSLERADRAASLPTGIVTFVMTDVVGSTPMWERAPHLMHDVMQRHNQIVLDTVAAHGGFVLQDRGEGDSTFNVFESTVAAVAASVDVQRRLAAEQWPELTPMAIRIGVHCGEVLFHDGTYFGRTINRAARVRGLAGAGQVFLSGAAAAMVEDQLPGGTEMRFLRMEVLRGTDTPEAVHEVVDHTRPAPVAMESSPTFAAGPLPAPLVTALPRVFAGRTELLEAIDALGARPAPPRVVILSGEPGAGKSTLAAVAAQRAHDAGSHVLFGSCDEAGHVPYEPMRDVMAKCVDAAPRAVLTEHTAVHGGEVGRLTTRLAARLGALGPAESTDIDTTRLLLTEAVVDLFARVTALAPHVVVVDDLQWADRNTLHVIEQLTVSDVGNLLFIATARSTHDRDDFGGWLERMRRRPNVHGFDVGGLDEPAMHELLVAVAGHELGDEGRKVVDHLAGETGGNPFYIVEVLRHLVESGVVGHDDGGRWRLRGDLGDASVPRSVRLVLQERIGRLGARSAKVLEAASVVGREFDPQIVAAMLDQSELDLLDQLEGAVASSLVRENAAGSFEFSHALVQHTLYDTIGATRRGVLHRQAAVAMEEAWGEQAPAAAIAHHWYASARSARERLVHWSRRAGADALEALAPEDAVRWYERALTAVDDEATRLELLIELGVAQRWARREFRETLLEAAALAERLADGPSLVRAALANHRGGASRAGEVDRERVDVLERALREVGEHDSADRARLLATIAIETSQGDEIGRSIALADEALAVARRVDDDLALFQVLLRVTEATRIPSTLDFRLDATRELFDIADRLGDPVQLGFAAVRDVRTKYEAARFDEVDRAFAVMDRVAHLDPFVQHNHQTLLAVRAHVAGRLDDALAHAERARELGVNERDVAAVYVSTTSMIRWDQGTLAEMLPLLDRIRREFPGVVGFRPSVALAELATGNHDAAREILLAGVATEFADHPVNPLWAMTMSLYATLCIELDEPRAADLLYGILEPMRGHANTSVVSINGLVTESLAGLALVAGDHARAVSDAEAALEQAERVGAVVSAVRSRFTLSRALAPADGAAAVAHAERAAADAARVGMSSVASQAAAHVQAVAR